MVRKPREGNESRLQLLQIVPRPRSYMDVPTRRLILSRRQPKDIPGPALALTWKQPAKMSHTSCSSHRSLRGMSDTTAIGPDGMVHLPATPAGATDVCSAHLQAAGLSEPVGGIGICSTEHKRQERAKHGSSLIDLFGRPSPVEPHPWQTTRLPDGALNGS